MMPQVLTTNAIILCPHGFPGLTTPSQSIWMVDGGYVCLDGDTGTVPLCVPPAVYTPCLGYTLTSMKLNSTFIMGRRVILVTDFTVTETGLPMTLSETNTTYDDSTVAPLPAGQPPPLLPPALQDTTPPSISGSPSPLPPFSVSAMTPATNVATFQLETPFPMSWSLTRVSLQAPALSVDLTGGDPPGAVVASPGGAWDSSSLTVTMTLNAAYMAALPQGSYRFYMTGVSQRGISSYASVDLTVGP
jgi:hypothetical protein